MESKKSSKPPLPYRKELKKLLNEQLIDIILFGSVVKGGSPKDIDIALMLKDTTNLLTIKKKIKEIIKKETDIQIITFESIHTPLWLTLIKEGFSIKKEKYLHELYHLQPKVLYKYSLQKLTLVQKVQFERGIKMILGSQGTFLTRSVVLIPLTLKNRMMEFLKSWNIYYETQEYELLPIQRKEEW
ncbi:hypothetical protein A2642_04460 [Candidatus Nomurabacteria bacterium RIFCSPHIGHO2_01_FULL_39_10]|uniref:Polymerase beta nucleotidyltransferase domain-containing protein n=1 Tax=Candidatus Nomurabacteria bacterium RIFCSPHIGHO2_01_FULL_39_10 TaxID=1801733 RepID=A0A1F6V4U0_9BACT|nr:MAG: hypothetical protein A2642_04460 [Candidatus Nomurabacteria bacterium RIFCSPHIGHO2_01_FULL_39_10]